jgi:hypothetical protein
VTIVQGQVLRTEVGTAEVLLGCHDKSWCSKDRWRRCGWRSAEGDDRSELSMNGVSEMLFWRCRWCQRSRNERRRGSGQTVERSENGTRPPSAHQLRPISCTEASGASSGTRARFLGTRCSQSYTTVHSNKPCMRTFANHQRSGTANLAATAFLNLGIPHDRRGAVLVAAV